MTCNNFDSKDVQKILFSFLIFDFISEPLGTLFAKSKSFIWTLKCLTTKGKHYLHLYDHFKMTSQGFFF